MKILRKVSILTDINVKTYDIVKLVVANSSNEAAGRFITSMMKGNQMKNRTVVYQAPTPVNHASEIEYADFMHYSAAYLPSGEGGLATYVRTGNADAPVCPGRLCLSTCGLHGQALPQTPRPV